MQGKKQSRTNPLQTMWRAPKPPAFEVEEQIDLCNELLERVDVSLTERANATDGKKFKTSSRSRARGGQHRPPKGKHEPGKESVKDAFEKKLEAVAITKRHVKGRREELMVDFPERRCRRQSERLVVEFPSENARAHRAHRYAASAPPLKKKSRKYRLKNSELTADTEVSFDELIEDLNSTDKETTKKKEKKQMLGDFTHKFDWSESSIVWGDEECSSDEETSKPHEAYEPSSAKDPSGMNFTTSAKFRSLKRSDRGRSILSRGGCRRSRDPTCSRSVMSADLSSRSMESTGSNPLWQSLSTLNVSCKKLEP
jgi:hypothetical protein